MSAINWEQIQHLGLWDHQAEAVEVMHEYLHRYDRSQMLLTMGGGKTRIDLAILHQFIGEVMGPTAGENDEKLIAVIVVPTLTLMRQIRDEVDTHLVVPHPYRLHAMASDKGVAQGDIQLSDLGMEPTTDGRSLRKAIYDPQHSDKAEIVLTTFDCAAQVKRAVGARRRAGTRVLVVIDEAHRSEAETFRAAREIDCDWMLSQTGTQGHEMAVRTDLYGPVGYSLDQEEAQRRGIVRDYKVVATPIRTSDLEALIAEGSGSPYEGMNIRDAATVYAMEVTLGDPDNQVKAGIGFFERIAKSKRAQKALDGRVLADGRTVRTWHLDGSMNVDKRAGILKAASDVADGEVNLLLNAQALTEGINFTVANFSMIDKARGPKPSAQAIARALRITDDPERPGVVGKAIVVNDSDPENPVVEKWSIEDFEATLEDIKHYHDKIDQHIVLPDEPAPPPPERNFGGSINKTIYLAQNDAIMRTVSDAVEIAKKRLIGIAGRRYHGVRWSPREGRWHALLRNPKKGPKPEGPRMGRVDPEAAKKLAEWEATPSYLLDDYFDYASDAARAFDQAIDEHELLYEKNTGRNPRVADIAPLDVPGVYKHPRGTGEAQLYVPMWNGDKKRLTRGFRSVGDTFRAHLALAARFGFLDEYLERIEKEVRKKKIREYEKRGEDVPREVFSLRYQPAREEINFGLIRLPRLESKRFEGVERCPAQRWWAFAIDKAGRTLSLGHYEAEEIAAEVACRGREIIAAETQEQHLEEGVLALSERIGKEAYRTMNMTRLAASAPRPARSA